VFIQTTNACSFHSH